MGGSSKKQTVAHRILLGMHHSLCLGPIDYIRSFKVDKKTAKAGTFDSNQTVTIDAENLFGGETQEGGVSGDVDVLLGGPTQTKNDYLESQLGSDIPSFRGTVSVVLRQVYLGLNRYLKRWSYRASRIHVRQNGLAQWYDEKAEISPVTLTDMGATLPGGSTWTGLVVGADNKIYGIPHNSADILIISPLISSAVRSNMGAPLTTGAQKYYSGVLAANGKIYCAPFDATEILIIDTLANSASLSTLGASLAGLGKWSPGAAAPNGKIYYPPHDSLDILIIDSNTDTASRDSMLQAFSGTRDYSGAIYANGSIFCIPFEADNVLVIDPDTDTAVKTTMLGLLPLLGSKWNSGVLAPDGKIYCIPFNATDILIIDTASGLFSTSTMGADLTGTNKWAGGVLGSDGLVYGIPFNSPDFLVIDPVEGLAIRTKLGADIPFGGSKWHTGTAHSDGNMYFTPHTAIEIAKVNPSLSEGDMNPAHIIREALTDPDWGNGHPETDIDDTSFEAAADKLFDQQVGISLLWDRQNRVSDFIREIEKHIDGICYVDPATGKFNLKLVDADYDVNTLVHLTTNSVEKVAGLKKRSFEELTNSVTVNYWNARTGENASVTAQDPALDIHQNSSINTTAQYPGFTNAFTAGRAASRDLKALSSAIWSGTIYANSDVAKDLQMGDVFLFSWPDFKIDSLVFRVTGLSYGDGKKNLVKISASEDVFDLPSVPYTAAPSPLDGFQPPNLTAAPIPVRMVQEAPYYEVVQQQGQASTDTELAADPDQGFVIAAGNRPANASLFNALMKTDPASTGDFEQVDVLEFAPSAVLTTAVDRMATTFTIEDVQDLELIEIGTHVQIGDELCRVDAVSSTTLEVGRAILDTVPQEHSAGSVLVFWDNFVALDETPYADSEVVDVKLITSGGEGELPEADAPTDSVTLSSRAIKPYPPANLTVNLEYFPETIPGNAGIELAWAHRDRTQQTSGSFFEFTDTSIGPEVGTTYNVRLYGEDDLLGATITGITGDSLSYTTAQELIDFGVLTSGIADPDFDDVVLLTHAEGPNGSTTITDNSNSAHTITANNCALSTTQAKFGGSSLLIGNSGNSAASLPITTDFEFTDQDFTIEMWVRINTPAQAFGRIFQLADGDIFSGISLTLGNGPSSTTLGAYMGSAGTSFDIMNVSAAGVLSGGVWQHIALVRNGTDITYYLDGASLASVTTSASVHYDSLNTVVIGGNVTSTSRSCGLFIDDVRVTKGLARYTGPFSVPIDAFPDSSSSTGTRLNGQVRIEIESERDGHVSQQHEITISRVGYGFNYGEYYGDA